MPGGYKNIKHEDGKAFSSTNQPARNGRKKLLTTMAKESGYSADEVVRVMSYVLTLTKKEREKIYHGDPDGLEAAVIRALEKSISTGDWGRIQNIIEHIAGRPIQKAEATQGELTIRIVRDSSKE